MRALAASLRAAAPQYLWDNPIFLKEYRLQFRSHRTYMLHFAYIFVLGTALTILVLYAHLAAEGGGRVALWKVGQWTFRVVIFLHAAFLAVLMSTMASSSVTGEREMRTYELLEALPMTTGMFVAGKFISLLVWTGLLILSSMPLFILSLSYVGGVGVLDIACAYATLAGLSAACAAGGILASSVSETSRAAIFLCLRILFLLTIFVWFGGAWALAVFFSTLYGGGSAGSEVFDALMMPFASTRVLATLCVVSVYAAVSSLLLTAAADQLRPDDEKRPHWLLAQVFVLMNAGCAGLLLIAVGAGRAAATATSSAATAAAAALAPFGGLGYFMMQATGLLCLTMLVLPVRDSRQGGWRALFSQGPRGGTTFLIVCMLSSDALLAAAGPLLPAAGTLPASDWLRSQAIVLGMLLLCGGMARFATALSERYGRAFYFAGLLLFLLAPFIAHSVLFRGTEVLLLTPLIWLNPWIALGHIDAKTGEAILRTLGLPIDAVPGFVSLALAPALGALLFSLGTRLETMRRPSVPKPLAP